MGFGAAVIAILKNSKIKRNLYYEYKERVTEERNDGYRVNRKTKTMKVFGFDETASSRKLLMDILRQRMMYHKGKFVSPTIYQELCTLEVKKNGRIEHASNAHDDQIFSMLLALYVWYEGKDLMEHFGLQKDTITTDDDETIDSSLPESYVDISGDITTETDPELDRSLKILQESAKYKQYNQFAREYADGKEKELQQLIAMDPVAKKAYAEKYHVDMDELGDGHTMVEIPTSIFLGIYDNDGNKMQSTLQNQFNNITDIR